jgi:hypothetical protein
MMPGLEAPPQPLVSIKCSDGVIVRTRRLCFFERDGVPTAYRPEWVTESNRHKLVKRVQTVFPCKVVIFVIQAMYNEPIDLSVETPEVRAQFFELVWFWDADIKYEYFQKYLNLTPAAEVCYQFLKSSIGL